jgi:hypothetical protein
MRDLDGISKLLKEALDRMGDLLTSIVAAGPDAATTMARGNAMEGLSGNDDGLSKPTYVAYEGGGYVPDEPQISSAPVDLGDFNAPSVIACADIGIDQLCSFASPDVPDVGAPSLGQAFGVV